MSAASPSPVRNGFFYSQLSRFLLMLLVVTAALWLTILYHNTFKIVVVPFRLTDSDTHVQKQSNTQRAARTAVAGAIQSASLADFPVHLFRFYESKPNSSSGSLCYTECVSVLSIMTFLKPSDIYLHTEYPEFWPFSTCEDLITNWTSIKIVPAKRRFILNGRKIKFIHHEADFAKLIALYEYGGISMDIDVVMLPRIDRFYKVMNTGFQCMAASEIEGYFNLGFLGCWPKARYVRKILERYYNDYQDAWLYNSGAVPFQLYRDSADLKKTVFVDDTIADAPNWYNRGDMWDKKGVVDWRNKTAYHSYYHDCGLNATAVQKSQTSFGLLLKFIVEYSETKDAGLLDKEY